MSFEDHDGKACQARTFSSGGERTCSRTACHWTHEFSGGRRLEVCTQHFKIAQRWRDRRATDSLLAFWAWEEPAA